MINFLLYENVQNSIILRRISPLKWPSVLLITLKGAPPFIPIPIIEIIFSVTGNSNLFKTQFTLNLVDHFYTAKKVQNKIKKSALKRINIY